MVARFTEDFQVEWKHPDDGRLTWLYDPMHFPRPLLPLTGEFLDRMYSAYMSARTVYINGFAFTTGISPRPPTPEIMKRGVFDVWTKDCMPRVQTFSEELRAADYNRASLTELGDAVEIITARAVEAFGLTMIVISGFMGPTFGLVQFLQSELGADGAMAAATLLQGFENGSAAAGAGLSELADAATKSPAVAAALSRGDYDSVESVEGGPEFMKLFRDYLSKYGWRVESWGQLHRPTWAEDQRIPLMLVGRYVSDPSHAPAAAIARAVKQREEMTEEVESKLTGEKLQQFRGLLAGAQAHVPVSEGRALWQLIIIGSLRVPFLALGRKLVAAGAFEQPEDVFLMTTDELKDAAHSPSSSVRSTVVQRRGDYQRWETLTPPPFVGTPPDPSQIPPEMQPILHLFFGVGAPVTEGRQLKGQGASKGVVRGRARVIKDLSDSSRLQKGDILVCANTAPPWTPLFAVASGVVTDSGGILSHSAICAREYAIPCVVATQIGTSVIKDGSMIVIDGSKGTVEIGA
jgi:phosphohistidine swiveling domain-containing protein